MITRLILKYAFYEDFRKNERTLAERHPKEMALLKPSEGVLFISQNGKMLRFVSAPQVFNNLTAEGSQHTVLPSQIYRITDGGTWSPYMLKNYAAALGIELVGRKTFEQHYKEILELKAAKRAADKKHE